MTPDIKSTGVATDIGNQFPEFWVIRFHSFGEKADIHE
jgi:hypothetical protein